MAEVSDTRTTTPTPPVLDETEDNVNDKDQPATATDDDDADDEPARPVVRKTWANLTQQPSDTSSNNNININNNNNKNNLLSIMAEEEEISQANQRKKEEDQVLRQAIQASLTNKNTTTQTLQDDDEDFQLAIQLSMMEQHQNGTQEINESTIVTATSTTTTTSAAAVASLPLQESNTTNGLSPEELASIEKALREAEEEEAVKSIQLAMQLQEDDEDRKISSSKQQRIQGNVRTLTRAEYLREQQEASLFGSKKQPPVDYDHDDVYMGEAGYRINSSQKASSSQWTRVDQNTILGPNNEIRTKHDLELQGQSNAHRLQLDLIEDDEKPAFVGNKAFNSFKRTMQKKTSKGVATQGQGRANADSEKTKQGALDGRVRIQITKTINSGLIEKFNGCVKEGKEALVYHADKGAESEGYDVAVKIFKRIQEFRNRGQYVDGDPRFYGKDFSHASGREQLEIWADKEFRNLVRAHRARVPVPKPLVRKENVLFMRFLGEDGWPSPQLRELEMKKGSKKWSLLYEQTMNAIQILYSDARLVHGDLSEYNILVCPSNLLPNGDDDEAGSKDDGGDSLQIALIDFGQAVDLRHPDAVELLRRDLLRVKQFFDKMGITTVDLEPAVHFVQTKGAPLR